MLDPRLYRAAFAPLLLAAVVAAFSLVDRPRPIQTTLAPDVFDGPHAFATLRSLAAEFPARRPGSAGDERLARLVALRLRSSFCEGGGACEAVRLHRFDARTIDGQRTLLTVAATRLGQPGPGLVVVAHRDAAGRTAAAELSGTAALLELARVFGGRQTKRTLTLVSTSGGSGGAAGARELAGALPPENRSPDAVLVLGDLASARIRKPWVMPWSSAARLAPNRLRRSVEAAVRSETGQEAGGVHAGTQFARLAFPFALGEEGPLNAAGLPAVLLQASGQRGPGAGAPVSAAHLRVFGRAALRSIDALDNGPDVSSGPSARIAMRNKVLPPWVVRMLVAALLLPALLAGVDGFARARRRHAPVAAWLRWLVVLAVPLVAVAALARFMGATGLLGAAPRGAVRAGIVPVDGVALAVLGVAFALGCLAVRPLSRMLGVPTRPEGPGPAAAVGLATVALAVAVWAANPFAAALLVLPAHVWLLVAAPELRLRRGAGLVAAVLALVPVAAVLAVFAGAVGASAAQLPWSVLLLVAGGQIGLLALLATCAAGACGVAAARLALVRRPEEASATSPSVRGPLGHAGPGSLGGTDSAIRIRR